MKTSYADTDAFVTKDRSLIRELMHPARHGESRMSFAEAIVEAGATTQMHLHRESEEIYHITEGVGVMRLGGEEFAVREGDTIKIPPGTPHNIKHTGGAALRVLCLSSPAYSDGDTTLL